VVTAPAPAKKNSSHSLLTKLYDETNSIEDFTGQEANISYSQEIKLISIVFGSTNSFNL
jgi:hypothetical protein